MTFLILQRESNRNWHNHTRKSILGLARPLCIKGYTLHQVTLPLHGLLTVISNMHSGPDGDSMMEHSAVMVGTLSNKVSTLAGKSAMV